MKRRINRPKPIAVGQAAGTRHRRRVGGSGRFEPFSMYEITGWEITVTY
jgi:hypothetical protein